MLTSELSELYLQKETRHRASTSILRSRYVVSRS